MKKNKLAFSLVELAVVVLIIGLITAGMMKGTSLVRSSRLTSARSLTAQSRINEIPGMIAWYETSLIDSFRTNQVTDTSQLTEWRDISQGSIVAQKNKLTRVASSNVVYKTDGINNLPSVQFKPSGNFTLSAFYQGNMGQNTIFIVVRPTVTPSSFPPLCLIDSHSSSQYNNQFGITDTKAWIDIGSTSSTATISNQPSFTANNNYILVAYFDNTNSKVFVNNALSMAGGSLIAAGNNELIGLTVGSTKAGAMSTAFTGLISEIIIYDRPLPIDERKSVMSYLSKKYKIRVVGI